MAEILKWKPDKSELLLSVFSKCIQYIYAVVAHVDVPVVAGVSKAISDYSGFAQVCMCVCVWVGGWVSMSSMTTQNHSPYHHQTWQVDSIRQVLVNDCFGGNPNPDSFVDPASFSRILYH